MSLWGVFQVSVVCGKMCNASQGSAYWPDPRESSTKANKCPHSKPQFFIPTLSSVREWTSPESCMTTQAVTRPTLMTTLCTLTAKKSRRRAKLELPHRFHLCMLEYGATPKPKRNLSTSPCPHHRISPLLLCNHTHLTRWLPQRSIFSLRRKKTLTTTLHSPQRGQRDLDHYFKK